MSINNRPQDQRCGKKAPSNRSDTFHPGRPDPPESPGQIAPGYLPIINPVNGVLFAGSGSFVAKPGIILQR